MTLRRAVSVPFSQRGVERMKESEFVVALSLDRDWFSPDQAKRIVDVASGEGLIEQDGEALVITFDTQSVEIPDDFEPDDSIIQQRSTFERVLDVIVGDGVEKQTAVAEINQLQAELEITLEAAAILYARRRGLEVRDLAERALDELTSSHG